jgi:hypothetical protein
MEPITVPETGKLTQSTRRSFIRGIATAGASTAAAVALERAGIDLFATATADAAPGTTPFSQFTAIAPSPADAFQVPEGYRAESSCASATSSPTTPAQR